jgi:hypothetical protein
MALISSVDILTVALPRKRRTISWPRVSPRGARALTIRTVSPSNSKSTSVCGNRPAFSRISTGIVTCPFEVILIASSKGLTFVSKI